MKLVCSLKEIESEYVNISYQIKYRISFQSRNNFSYLSSNSDSYIVDDYASYVLITQNKDVYDKYEIEKEYTIELK